MKNRDCSTLVGRSQAAVAVVANVLFTVYGQLLLNDVVEVEIEPHAILREPEPLRRPEIELVQILIAVFEAFTDQLNGLVRRTGIQRPAERIRRRRVRELSRSPRAQVARMAGPAPPVCTPRLN